MKKKADGAVANGKIWRQPLVLNELLKNEIATARNKPEGGFSTLFLLDVERFSGFTQSPFQTILSLNVRQVFDSTVF